MAEEGAGGQVHGDGGRSAWGLSTEGQAQRRRVHVCACTLQVSPPVDLITNKHKTNTEFQTVAKLRGTWGRTRGARWASHHVDGPGGWGGSAGRPVTWTGPGGRAGCPPRASAPVPARPGPLRRGGPPAPAVLSFVPADAAGDLRPFSVQLGVQPHPPGSACVIGGRAVGARVESAVSGDFGAVTFPGTNVRRVFPAKSFFADRGRVGPYGVSYSVPFGRERPKWVGLKRGRPGSSSKGTMQSHVLLSAVTSGKALWPCVS